MEEERTEEGLFKANALEEDMAVPKLRGGRGGVANAEGDALAVT